jgi:peptidoglycan/LPS O-acetylase OafA/YrhL
MGGKPAWHMDYLDSLRGIAVLGVIMVHASLTASGAFLKIYKPLQWVAFTGQRGVALFFVVSAFTLFLSLDNRRREHRPVLNFFLRRFFRLAPMFYLAIVITHFLLPEFAGTFRQNVLAVLFLQGLSPAAIGLSAAGGWSVADEALFYVCLPFLFSWIKDLKTALIVMVAGSVAGFIFMAFLGFYFPANAEYFQFFSITAELPIFFQGICAYFIWKEMIVGMPWSDRGRKQISALLLLMAGMLYCLLLPFNNVKLYPSTAVCLLLLLGLSAYPWPLFVNRATRFLGKISYSIYLLHFTVNIWLQKWMANWIAAHPQLDKPHADFVAVFATILLVTVPLASLTWRWIEEPGIRAGRKFGAYLERRASSDQLAAPAGTAEPA